jgi:hypothetical protein
MARLPAYDWSAWSVCVHDGEGRCVAVVPFPAQASAEPRRRGAVQERWSHSHAASVCPTVWSSP